MSERVYMSATPCPRLPHTCLAFADLCAISDGLSAFLASALMAHAGEAPHVLPRRKTYVSPSRSRFFRMSKTKPVDRTTRDWRQKPSKVF